ncbi:carbohydrate-binding protein [Aquimarina sp. RZ0]|uniref:carbohydrate-binding protein n=1 Tax=Aquimarina sp. RZ0 TaxID=2607730 RepID=UPI001CB70661|nr:carbohydrate-binding protein [Aquimarina sp. RZ0]
MRKLTLLILTALLCNCYQSSYAQTPTPPNGKRWVAVSELTDEFNGNSINSSKWDDFHPHWAGRPPSKFKKGNAFVEDGYLKLRSTLLRNPNSVNNPLSDIWVNSAACVSKGKTARSGYYYEARFKASSLSMTSSFWFRVGQFSEIDVIEHIGNPSRDNRQDDLPFEYAANTHYYGPHNGKPNKKASWRMPTRGRDGFHTYGFWWKSPTELLFYYDGRQVMRIVPRIPFDENLKMVFDTEVFPFAQAGVPNIGLPKVENLNNNAKNTMLVDWVRTYKLENGSSTIPVTGVSISDSNVTLNTGQIRDLNATVRPNNASNKSVSWSSNNNAIATVNSNGLVTAISEGSATITVTTADGNKKATSQITVNDNTPPPPPSGSDIIIEAETFTNTDGTFNDASAGGPGLGMNATSTGVNYVNSGDWSEYSINVASAGNYNVSYRVSSPSDNAQIQLLIDGTVVATDNVRNNGTWDNYISLVSSSTITNLSAGRHTVRVVASGSNPWQWNLDKIILKRISGGGNSSQTVTLSPVNDSYMQGNNNQNNTLIRIESGKREGYLMFDLSGINGAITDAKLKFEVTSDAGNGNLTVHKGTSNNWSETNLSNGNKPGAGVLLGSINKTYSLNATETINLRENDISGNRLSLVLRLTSGNDFAFASKEHSSNSSAKLVISYASQRAFEDDIKEANEILKIYPNPVKDFVTIDGLNQHDMITIYDILGSKVLQLEATSENETISATSLTPGIYFVSVLGKKRLRFIKQ